MFRSGALPPAELSVLRQICTELDQNRIVCPVHLLPFRHVMRDIERRPSERICGPDHLCLFYTSRAEQLAVAVPFIESGLKRAERCVYIADENPMATIEA